MTSIARGQKLRAAQLHKEDWETLKPFIRTRYLIQNKELDQILAELHERGLSVTKSQLEFKLKSWGFRKKLSPEIWRHVERVIQARLEDLKETAVILAGRRLPNEKVEYETRRNRLVTWRPVSTKSPRIDCASLYLCTPRGSCADLNSGTVWHDSLPWIEFMRSHFLLIQAGIKFLSAPSTPVTVIEVASSGNTTPDMTHAIQQLARYGHGTLSTETATLLPAIFEKSVRRSMSLIFGSEEMAKQLFVKMSVDCIAARLDMVIPEAYSDANLQASVVLANGTPSDMGPELVKIIIYLTSNRLILDERNEARDYLEEAQEIISLLRLCGLTDPRVIRKLVDTSQQSLTLTAVVDMLFEAAVNAEATDIVSCLLDADCGVDLERRIRLVPWTKVISGVPPILGIFRGTALELAITRNSIPLVTVLLDHGAKIQGCSFCDLSFLATAIFIHPRGTKNDMAQLLIKYGANINETPSCDKVSPLQAAIIVGDMALIEALITAGADVNYRWNGNIWPLSFTARFRSVDSISCLGFAASFSYRSCFWYGVESYFDGQEFALELCQWLLSKYAAQMNLSSSTTSDAMILAATCGYSDVVSFLHKEASGNLNYTNNGYSPISAAVYFGHIATAEVLFELGVSAEP
ncbi:ankyrin, partial [Thozetella sp. PMI_491]